MSHMTVACFAATFVIQTIQDSIDASLRGGDKQRRAEFCEFILNMQMEDDNFLSRLLTRLRSI